MAGLGLGFSFRNVGLWEGCKHRWLCFRTCSLSLGGGSAGVRVSERHPRQPPRPGPTGWWRGEGGGGQQTESRETQGQGRLLPERRQGHGEPRVCEDATTSDGTICPDGGMVTREKKVGALARGS